MAVDAASTSTTSSPSTGTTNGSSPAAKPIELAIPLPFSPSTRIHAHLTVLATSIILFVTTADNDPGASAALGSFVHALPDRYNPSQPLSTPLYISPPSLDFATRLARLLARRTGKAVYVGSSAGFEDGAGGGTVEEELDGFRRVVEVVLGEVEKARKG